MKILNFLSIAFSIISISAMSQNPVSQYLENNQVRALYSNNNMLFWDQLGTARYEVPKGSGKNSLFSHSLWIGGLDVNNQLHISAHRYLQSGQDFYPGQLHLSGDSAATCDSATSYQQNQIWAVSSYEIQEFRYRFEHNLMTGYTIPNSIVNWPAQGAADCDFYLAPFVDYNEDSYYNPNDGDYPAIKGDQMLFWVFNDNTKPHTETGGLPLGVEVRCMAYAFTCDSLIQATDGVLNYTTFLTYQIINRSAQTYHDAYIGLYTDGDLGYAVDDYVGFNLEKNAYYFYNGTTIDGNGQTGAYGTNPPAQAVVLLQGLFKDADGVDDLSNWDDNNVLKCDSGFRFNSVSGHKEYVGPGNVLNGNINGFHYGDGIADNEMLGFSRFMYFNNGGCSDICDPITDSQYYNYLSGKWKDGIPLTYGGTGHALSGTNARFMFPGNSDLCNYGTDGVSESAWSEVSVNNPPGDRRGIASIGPVTIDPGRIMTVDLAFVWSRDSVGGNVLNKLFNDIDKARSIYSVGDYIYPSSFASCQYAINAAVPVNNINHISIKIFPSLTNSVLNIELDKIQPEKFHYCISTIQGVDIIKGDIIESKTQIPVYTLSQGVYIIKIINGDENWTYRFVKI